MRIMYTLLLLQLRLPNKSFSDNPCNSFQDSKNELSGNEPVKPGVCFRFFNVEVEVGVDGNIVLVRFVISFSSFGV